MFESEVGRGENLVWSVADSEVGGAVWIPGAGLECGALEGKFNI